MNKHYSLVALALAAAFTACDDQYLDQSEFEGIGHEFSDVKTIAYTLTDADYASIAGNATNKALALAKSPEDSLYYNALQNLKTLKYFTELCPADEYIPAFIAAKYPNADEKSKYNVTYNTALAPATYMADFASLSAYTLSVADYEKVWGSDLKVYFLSPSTAQAKLPGILKSAIKTANAGDMVAVSYAYSDTEPSLGGGTGGSGSDEPSYTPVGTIASADAGTYSAHGQVAATYTRGFLLNDATGNILVYSADGYDVKIGDVVVVSGATSKYGGLMQFATPEVTVEKAGTFTQPKAQKLDASAITAYASQPYCGYVTFDGKLVLSGNYVNIEVEGTDVKGSVAYAPAGMVDAALDGQQVTVVGYAIGVTGSSSKFLNVMATSVKAFGSAPDDPVVGPGQEGTVSYVAQAEAGEYEVKGTVAALYKRGFLLHDDTGNILVYKAAGYEVKVGDQVNVKGKTKAYAGLMQFDAAEVSVLASGSFTYPSPRVLSADDITAYVAAPYCDYISFVGKLVLSGNYVNIEIEGTTVQGSVAYALDGLIDAALDGQQVTVTGYSIGQTSSGKYLSVMATSVTAASASAPLRAPVVTSVQPTHSVLYRFNGTDWQPYTTDDAQVAVFAPSDYEMLGTQTLSGDVESVVSRFLQGRFPYAQLDQKAVAVYAISSGLVAKDYVYADGWKAVKAYCAETTVFSQASDGITAKISTYIDDSMLGTTAGFEAHDVLLDGINYVWKNDSKYGWKGTAHVGACHNADSYLVSQSFNFSKATAPYVTFDEAINYMSDRIDDFLNVLVSTDFSGDPTACHWTNITDRLEARGDGKSWTYVNVGHADLSDFAGQTSVVLAFRYSYDLASSVGCATWEIKNFKIAEAEE